MDDVDAAATTITMPAGDVTVQANFEVDPAQTYTLTLNVLPASTTDSFGTATDITATGPYTIGEEVSLTATPDQTDAQYYSHVFEKWTGDTQYITTGSETDMDITVTMPETDITLTANFKRDNEVLVEAGTYTRGNTRGTGHSYSEREEPTHEVILTRDFYVSKYEVTYDLFDLSSVARGSADFGTGQRPVIRVSWYGAIEFADWLSMQHGLTQVYGGGPYDDSVTMDLDANGYRLPTEAEWEYAARGGHLNPHNPGDTGTDYLYAGTNQDPPDDYCWYTGNSGSETQIVGQKLPNELGLYDMGGNVWEWVWDWYPDSGDYSVYPGAGGATDPTGSPSGSGRLRRGGSWYNDVDRVRVSRRGYNYPSSLNRSYGLRLFRTR